MPPFKRIISERESFIEQLESLKVGYNELINENKQLTKLNEELRSGNSLLEKSNEELKNKKASLIESNKVTEIKNVELSKKITELEFEKEELVLKSNFSKEKIELLNENIDSKNTIEIEDLYAKIQKLNEDSLKMADFNSGNFWEKNYSEGGNSGTGSYNKLAEFKAEIVRTILKEHSIKTIIEIGCGDGNQLSLIDYEDYTGVYVSKTIIEKNKIKFKDKTNFKFFNTDQRDMYSNKKYDMSISMDVIFHLLEQDTFENYMNDLFNFSKKLVVIYSSNHEEYTKWPEYRHRNFTKFVADNFSSWELIKYIPNKYPYIIGKEDTTSCSDFYIYSLLS